jgi:hypothetical protein
MIAIINEMIYHRFIDKVALMIDRVRSSRALFDFIFL